jgi:hypothetical protein
MTTRLQKMAEQAANRRKARNTGKEPEWEALAIIEGPSGGSFEIVERPEGKHNGKPQPSAIMLIARSARGKVGCFTIDASFVLALSEIPFEELAGLCESKERTPVVIPDAPSAGQVDNLTAGAPWLQKPAMPGLDRNKVASMQKWLAEAGFPDAAVESNRAKLRQYVTWVIDTTGLFSQDGSRK